jgi:hypothetical protein
MSEKGSANVQSRDTANHPPTTSPTSGYGGNQEFNRWWEHWMSKVPNSRLSAKSTLTKDSPDKASYPSELDETMKQKDAA